MLAIQITFWIQGLFSGFVTSGRMAALVRRALAEVRTVPVLVRTVPVLLVYLFFTRVCTLRGILVGRFLLPGTYGPVCVPHTYTRFCSLTAVIVFSNPGEDHTKNSSVVLKAIRIRTKISINFIHTFSNSAYRWTHAIIPLPNPCTL